MDHAVVNWASKPPWVCARLMAVVVRILSVLHSQVDLVHVRVVSSGCVIFPIRPAQANMTSSTVRLWMGNAWHTAATKTRQGVTFLVRPVQEPEQTRHRADMSSQVQTVQVSCDGQ